MVGNRYAVADLHGQLDLYTQIKEYINESDVVYALGDFGDRGPFPWRTLRLALDDPQFIYLMGNHDFMLMEAMEEYFYCMEKTGKCDTWLASFTPHGKINLLSMNGGLSTLNEWAELSKEEQEYYYWKLKGLPLEIRLAAKDGEHFIYLSHAGFTPEQLEAETVEGFVWDRLHYYDKWDNLLGHTLIHGHTIISSMKRDCPAGGDYEERNGCLYYDNSCKICIDRGAHVTGETVLLNIDTLESKIFKVREDSEWQSEK